MLALMLTVMLSNRGYIEPMLGKLLLHLHSTKNTQALQCV